MWENAAAATPPAVHRLHSLGLQVQHNTVLVTVVLRCFLWKTITIQRRSRRLDATQNCLGHYYAIIVAVIVRSHFLSLVALQCSPNVLLVLAWEAAA